MTQRDDVNAAGEPAVIYLQLHGDGNRTETKPDDYRNGDVSWCWERIHEQDVQYVRADLSGTPARIPGAPTTEGYYWYRQGTWATLHNVHPGRGANWGKLIVETGAVTHTGNHIKRTPVGEMPGEWFGPLLPPPPSQLRIDPVEALLASIRVPYPKIAALLDHPQLTEIIKGWNGTAKLSYKQQTPHPTMLELFCVVGEVHVPLTIYGDFGVAGESIDAFEQWMRRQHQQFFE